MALANEFLRRPSGGKLTQMQLQKLVYISHGWSLALLDRALTTEEPEAWDYGPVYSDLYDHTKLFGSAPIGREITSDDDEPARFFGRTGTAKPYRAVLDSEESSIVEQVWRRYGSLSGAALSRLTHKPNTPWSQTYRQGNNTVISNDLIQNHFRNLAAQVTNNLQQV